MKRFFSSSQALPETGPVPRHVAVIMDGNGRWARKRFLPRVAGHKRGAKVLHNMVLQAIKLGVEYVTVFAFSSENWRRPPDEVSFLMRLFIEVLRREVAEMHKLNIRLKVVGDRSPFQRELLDQIEHAERLTAQNTGLTLTIAANYGGRWDIIQATNVMHRSVGQEGRDLTESDLTPHLAMHYAPEPDLLIRTGGEKRVSNFLLWQLAYTEFYFTETLWPDFNQKAFNLAVASFASRERRFGGVGQDDQAPADLLDTSA